MVNWVWSCLCRQSVLRSSRQIIQLLLLLPLGLSLASGCAQLQSLYQWSDVELQMQVNPTDTPGTYTVTGRTNLPENTQLTVAAVRYLQPDDRTLLNTQAVYSILSYQPADVVQGQWQTNLNLWQVAPDGKFQEPWQIEQTKLGLALDPDETVLFLATLAPIDDLAALEQELARRGVRFPQGSIFNTSEGFRYAQVQAALPIALPQGRTAPNPEDDNFGWGDRYIIPQEPQNPTELEFPTDRLTDAPPAVDELLR